MEKQEPRFTHDCDGCKFLGNYNGQDLYFCGNGRPFPTVIARFGNEGSQYQSGLEIAKGFPLMRPDNTVRELRVAYLLAKDLGYVE